MFKKKIEEILALMKGDDFDRARTETDDTLEEVEAEIDRLKHQKMQLEELRFYLKNRKDHALGDGIHDRIKEVDPHARKSPKAIVRDALKRLGNRRDPTFTEE